MEAGNRKIQANALHLMHEALYRYKLDWPEFGHNVAGHAWPSCHMQIEQWSKATAAVFVVHSYQCFHVLFLCRLMPNTKKCIKMSMHREVITHTQLP